MSHSKYDQTLALAGIYQAASLVKQIANKGSANNAQIEACIETLFRHWQMPCASWCFAITRKVLIIPGFWAGPMITVSSSPKGRCRCPISLSSWCADLALPLDFSLLPLQIKFFLIGHRLTQTHSVQYSLDGYTDFFLYHNQITLLTKSQFQ